MSFYHAPIPAAVFAQVADLAAQFPAYAVEVNAFPNDDQTAPEFCVTVFHTPERIVPDDKRQKPYTERAKEEIFFDAAGEQTDTATSRGRA
jgi:hypothetical protein